MTWDDLSLREQAHRWAQTEFLRRYPDITINGRVWDAAFAAGEDYAARKTDHLREGELADLLLALAEPSTGKRVGASAAELLRERLTVSCPRCHAAVGTTCYEEDGVTEVWPHDERCAKLDGLTEETPENREEVDEAAAHGGGLDVVCPECNAQVNSVCYQDGVAVYEHAERMALAARQ